MEMPHFNIEENRSFESALGFWEPCENLSRERHRLKGFNFFLKDSEFGAFIKLHFPSDAREAMVVLSQPEPKWNGCWRFQGSQKEFTRRGWCPVQRKLCGSPGDGLCYELVLENAQWVPGRRPEGSFHHRRDQLLSFYVRELTAFLSKSVLLLKAFCFASLPFPTTKELQEIIYFCGLLIRLGFGGWRCSPHAGPMQQG